MRSERKSQNSEAIDHVQHLEKLQRIRNARVEEMMDSNAPLKGIYCVYSMYWRPSQASLEE